MTPPGFGRDDWKIIRALSEVKKGKKNWNPLHSWFQFISFWHVWAVILCCQRLEMECPESKLYYIIQWLDIILCWGYKWNPWVSFSFRFSYDSICDNESFLNGKKMECSKHEMSSKDFLVFKNWFRQCYSVMWCSCFKFLLLFSCKSNFYTIFWFFLDFWQHTPIRQSNRNPSTINWRIAQSDALWKCRVSKFLRPSSLSISSKWKFLNKQAIFLFSLFEEFILIVYIYCLIRNS